MLLYTSVKLSGPGSLLIIGKFVNEIEIVTFVELKVDKEAELEPVLRTDDPVEIVLKVWV